MKTIQNFLIVFFATTLLTSCYREVVVVDTFNNAPVQPLTANQLISAYDLWYVDINRTAGFGETPFLQKAFTVSFINGVMYANNNIAGLGINGDGFGIDVGAYNAFNGIIDVQHDIDGFTTFDVFEVDFDTIELYNPDNDTSYFLNGYQRDTFDYDFVFYDNIHYFLQEYNAWEKTYTSNFGALNAFDNENYLQFLAGRNDATFRSSQDNNGRNTNNLIWDYTGIYAVEDVRGNDTLKALFLDYDFLNNEFFELRVINDAKIELFHPRSETVYEFEGRGYIQFLRQDGTTKGEKVNKDKLRKHRADKIENPRTANRV